MKKILLTCPPMLQSKKYFYEEMSKKYELVCPNVVQTLSEHELIKLLKDCNGWIAGDDPVTEKVLTASKHLEVVIKWGVGTDNVDYNAANQNNIFVKNTPNMFGNEVADVALGYLILISRKLHLIDQSIRLGEWKKIQGNSLYGKTAGILGLGDIGSCLAKRLNILGLNIYGWDPFVKEIPNVEVNIAWPEKISECDYIFFTCPLNKTTKNIFSENELKLCKDGVSIINVSRGKIINETVINRGLSTGKINFFASDVFENEPLNIESKFIKSSKTILGSHNASNTLESVLRTNEKCFKFLEDYFND